MIGEEIKRLRKASSFSGTKMASELGISQQQYSRYERGVNTISVDALLNILCILDCDVSSFFSYLRQQIEKDNHELYDTLKPLFYNFETHTEIEKYFLKEAFKFKDRVGLLWNSLILSRWQVYTAYATLILTEAIHTLPIIDCLRLSKTDFII